MGYGLAIDVGSYFTCAATIDDGPPQLLKLSEDERLPSLVYQDRKGALHVGQDALALAAKAPERAAVAPKRDLFHGEHVYLGSRSGRSTPSSAQGVPTSQLVGATLRFVKEAASDRHGGPPERMVLTHPHRWRGVHTADLLSAAAHAGLPAPELLAEPVAAAFNLVAEADSALDAGALVLVYDWGGDRLDVTLLRRTAEGFEVVSHARREDLGGEDVDEQVLLIAQGIHERRHGSTAGWPDDDRIGLRREAARVKEAIAGPGGGAEDFRLGSGASYRITRKDDFEPAVSSAVEQTGKVVRAVLARCGEGHELAAFHLVGGSSNIDLVHRMLQDEFGVVAEPADQPKGAVALGAALWLRAQESRLRARDLCVRAEAHRRAGRHEEALAAADEALALQSGYARALREKGMATKWLRRYTEAVPPLRKAAQLEPDAETLTELADALRMVDKYAEALKVTNQALALVPRHHRALAMKASALRLTGKHEKAVPLLRAAVELAPSYAFAQRELGEVLRLLGRHSEAHQALDTALSLEPENAFTLGTKGRVFLAQKESAKAVEYLERARKLDANAGWIKSSLREAYLLRISQALAAAKRLGEQGNDEAQNERLEVAARHCVKVIRLVSGFRKVDQKWKAEKIPDDLLEKLNGMYKQYTGQRLRNQDWLLYGENGSDPITSLVPSGFSWWYAAQDYNWLMWRTKNLY